MACDNLDNLNNAIAAAATQPKKVSGDAGSVEGSSVGELIQAANYTAAVCAAQNGGTGIRFRRMDPDGCAGWPYNRWPNWGR